MWTDWREQQWPTDIFIAWRAGHVLTILLQNLQGETIVPLDGKSVTTTVREMLEVTGIAHKAIDPIKSELLAVAGKSCRFAEVLRIADSLGWLRMWLEAHGEITTETWRESEWATLRDNVANALPKKEIVLSDWDAELDAEAAQMLSRRQELVRSAGVVNRHGNTATVDVDLTPEQLQHVKEGLTLGASNNVARGWIADAAGGAVVPLPRVKWPGILRMICELPASEEAPAIVAQWKIKYPAEWRKMKGDSKGIGETERQAVKSVQNYRTNYKDEIEQNRHSGNE